MKIKSPFKDYYDHQAHIHGGGDPRVTYARLPLDEKRMVAVANVVLAGATADAITLRCSFPFNWMYVIRRDMFGLGNNDGEDDFRWLVIAGRMYLLVGLRERAADPMQFSVLSEANPRHVSLMTRNKVMRSIFRRSFALAELVGVAEPALVPLSRTLQAPVFVISALNHSGITHDRRLLITLERTIPVLGELGLPAIYPPTQCYQDIAYYLGNVLHETPDLKPPASVSDADRLVQRGFDTKQSFRHRN